MTKRAISLFLASSLALSLLAGCSSSSSSSSSTDNLGTFTEYGIFTAVDYDNIDFSGEYPRCIENVNITNYLLISISLLSNVRFANCF